MKWTAPPPVVDGNVADDRQQLGRVAGDRQPPNRTEGLEALVRAVAFGARQQQLFAGLLKIAVAFGIKGFDRFVPRVGQRVGGDPQQVAPVVVPYRFFHRDRFVHNGFSFPLVCKAYAGIAEEMIAESCAARGQRVRRVSAFSGFGALRVCIVCAGVSAKFDAARKQPVHGSVSCVRGKCLRVPASAPDGRKRRAAEAPCPQAARARPPACFSAHLRLPVRVFYHRGTGKRHFFDKAAT